MYLAYAFAALTALSIVNASVLELVPRGGPGPNTVQCYTQQATTRGLHGLSTNWHTWYTPCTVTSTKIVKTTVTPTSTFTTTTTLTSTVSTVSTIPAPATFTPVQTSLPGSTYSGSGGADPAGKRDDSSHILVGRSSSKKPGLTPPSGHQWFPHGVNCNKWTHHPCVTMVVTSTKTIVETTSTSITTVTSTTSTTVTTYTSTLYAACASNNLADTYSNGTHFIEGEGGFDTVDTLTTDTAYDCCVAALLDNGGNTSVWVFQPSTGECDIGETDDTCPNPTTNPSTLITSPGGTLTVGNAYCGGFDSAIPEVSAAARV